MTFPLVPNSSWDIRDSSKLGDYIACPRKYFYLHILGWKVDQPAHDLHFGTCWHIAREHQLLHGYDDVQGAFLKFMLEYRKEFPDNTDILYEPKTPMAALAGLVQYATEYKHELDEYSLVEIDGVKMTEISGTVPVDDKRKLHYRMDSILQRNSDGMYLSKDHKSTTMKNFDPKWDREYYLNVQNGTYTHCLYCMFPIDKVLGVEFCKVGFEKLVKGSSKRPPGYYANIRHIQAFKDPEQMSVWLWNVLDILDDIDRDMDRLNQCNEGDPVMMAFRMNPDSCTKYHGCEFHDFCMSWTNPLQRCYQPEIGFKVEFWDPSSKPSTVKKDLEFPL